jgi:hypothetical protein
MTSTVTWPPRARLSTQDEPGTEEPESGDGEQSDEGGDSDPSPDPAGDP